MRVLPNSPVVRKKLVESGLRKHTGFAIVAIWRNNTFIKWVAGSLALG